jgi:hypothetical protein
MLVIARVLVGEPSVLLVDEPSEGLAPIMVAEIYAIRSELKQAGRAILLERGTGADRVRPLRRHGTRPFDACRRRTRCGGLRAAHGRHLSLTVRCCSPRSDSRGAAMIEFLIIQLIPLPARIDFHGQADAPIARFDPSAL